MSAWPEPASFADDFPRTTKYCKICQKDTPHEIRAGSGVIATICIPCLRRTLDYDLERD